MQFTKDDLNKIYHRTSGYCHLCHKKLSRRNYGQPGNRGAWEIEHSLPQSKGGTDHMNNLYASCYRCNRSKGNLSTRTARRWNNKTRAPLSRERRAKATSENTLIGIIGGGLFGLLIGGPALGVIGAISRGTLGNSVNPDTTG